MAAADTEAHFDVGQNTYETAKKVWSFGKGVVVVKLFLGTAEAVAGKLLDITQGKKLEDVDKEAVAPALARLDKELLNPGIAKLVTLVMPLYSKAEEVAVNVGICALISNLLNQVGLLKEQPEDKPVPVRVVVEDTASSSSRRGKTEPARKVASPALVQ
mmetsp:Transcript_24706/g.35459  ORF Transcript_24706/g.35459 Transcript_24706/m.35459 type:complete len:159 (-) Transcript_24706:1295-1771(-)